MHRVRQWQLGLGQGRSPRRSRSSGKKSSSSTGMGRWPRHGSSTTTTTNQQQEQEQEQRQQQQQQQPDEKPGQDSEKERTPLLSLSLSRVISRSGCAATTNRISSKHVMNCFQHITESFGALHSPCGGAPRRLHTNTHSSGSLICTTASAHTSPLVSDHTRVSHAHARPLHPRSTGFCAVWGCISSSSVK